jgi:transcriptional regulator GlxA family with amidase domain
MAPLQIGCILIPFQAIDVVGPFDVLSSSTKEYIASVSFPPEVASKGLEMEFHYIAESMTPSVHTANFHIQPTTTVEDCPHLDYLIIGGPKPDYVLSQPFKDFIMSRLDDLKIIFTTCTGAMVLAQTGLLDGKQATTNHICVPMAREMYPRIEWTTEKQWVVDEKFWTSGGACAGMDMMAHWVTERCGREVAEAGFAALDYEPRDINKKQVALSKNS